MWEIKKEEKTKKIKKKKKNVMDVSNYPLERLENCPNSHVVPLGMYKSIF